MRNTFGHLAATLVAIGLVAATGLAHARVDSASIEYKEWPDGKKPAIVLIRAPGHLCKDFDVGDRRQFRWQLPKKENNPPSLHEGMTKVGTTLLAKNHYQTDPSASGIVVPEIYTVVELAIVDASNPVLVRTIGERIIFPYLAGTGNFRIHREDIEALPPDWKKLALVAIKHNQLPNAIPILAAAYDDISDDDLREIVFEEGVTRTFCWRE